jgi:hypothetical protein
MQRFAEQLKEFPANCESVKHLEQDISKIAVAALVLSNKPMQGSPIVTDDGSQWHKSLTLFDNVYFCHRKPSSGMDGMEYAVIEHFPSGPNEIWMKGRNAVEVLKAFTQDQRRALDVWAEDAAAQVKEFFAEKYPGRDLSRVAETFMRRFIYSENC